jgi:hypothetical protein
VVLLGSAAAAILFVFLIARSAGPSLRDRWIIKFARIDDHGYLHTYPSGPELFRFGQVLNIRAYQHEFGDNAAYAKRVFKTQVRDPSKDHEARPSNFQPFAALDNKHGYVSENMKGDWRFRLRKRRAPGDPPTADR